MIDRRLSALPITPTQPRAWSWRRHPKSTLSGPSEWTELAAQLLADALENWGVGGKTAAGYGIGTVGAWKRPELRPSQVLGVFEAWLTDEANTATPQRERLREIADQWSTKLMSLGDGELERAVNAIKRAIKSPKLSQERDELLTRIVRRSVL